MAITTLAGVSAGLVPPSFYLKPTTSVRAAGTLYTSWYLTGDPPSASVSSDGMAGAALSAPVVGQIPFDNPASGNAYLARLDGPSGLTASGTSLASIYVCDRLWHNSGIDVTSTSAQTINSVTWPARDQNASTDGEGVIIGLEVSTNTTNAAFVSPITLGYTNSAGTSGRSGVMTTYTSLVNAGTFYLFPLQAGDTGVRSIQSITLNSSMTSGAIHLVALRVIADAVQMLPGLAPQQDAVALGFPRLYNNSVPFVLVSAGATNAGHGTLTAQYAHG